MHLLLNYLIVLIYVSYTTDSTSAQSLVEIFFLNLQEMNDFTENLILLYSKE